MTREEVKESLPFLEAFAEGKTIQKKDVQCGATDWTDMKTEEPIVLDNGFDYRIKPTPTYRHFANAEECWEEMQKHEPFGWIKSEYIIGLTFIYHVSVDGFWWGNSNYEYFSRVMEKKITFADGTPFGKQVKEVND